MCPRVHTHVGGDDWRSATFFDELLQLKCCPDLIRFFQRGAAKEITESFGAFQATADWLGWDTLEDPSTTVLVPGDGKLPRTAALFAFRTKWRCFSVDPEIGWPDFADPVDRLETIAKPIEEIRGQIPCEPEGTAVVVAVHAHLRLFDALWAFKPTWKRMVVVAMPCCKVLKVRAADGTDREPDFRKRYRTIWSQKNEVLLWDIPSPDELFRG